MAKSDKPKYWNYTIGLIVPLLAALSPSLIYPLIEKFIGKELPKEILGLVTGTIIGLLTIIPFGLLREDNVLGKSILCGLLCAEVMVFSGGAFPSMAGIALWLFFYWHSVEH